jgi:hypothetical protein
MDSCSRGRLRGDANPNGDRTGNRFLSLTLFFTLGVFFLGLFVLPDLLEMNDIYCCKADLEIPVSKLYDRLHIN